MRLISIIRPLSLSYFLAKLAGRFFSARLNENVQLSHNMSNALATGTQDKYDIETEIYHYHQHAAINYLNSFLYKKMNQSWLENIIIVEGLEYLSRESEQGLLVLSAHQHHLMLLGAAFGLTGHKTFPVLMDPKETVPAYLEQYYDMAISDSEKLYNGGKYMLVGFKPSFTREIYRNLKSGDIVISANDFPKDIAPKRRKNIPFYGQHISCPVGTIEIAIKTGAKIVTAFVTQSLDLPFKVTIAPLDYDEKNITSIVAAYGKELEKNILREPAAWEGWKWGGLFEH